MKTKLCLALCCVALAGCVNPQWPKDSHIEKGSVKVNTPWGGYEMTVEQLDTGSAARNATALKK
jgi:hypothetical protein